VSDKQRSDVIRKQWLAEREHPRVELLRRNWQEYLLARKGHAPVLGPPGDTNGMGRQPENQ